MGHYRSQAIWARRAQSPRMAARRSSGTAPIETVVLEMPSSNGPCGVATGLWSRRRDPPVRASPDDGDDDRELAVNDKKCQTLDQLGAVL